MRVKRASGVETEREGGGVVKDSSKSGGDAEVARGGKRGRRSFQEICRCAAGLGLACVAACAAAALFSH